MDESALQQELIAVEKRISQLEKKGRTNGTFLVLLHPFSFQLLLLSPDTIFQTL